MERSLTLTFVTSNGSKATLTIQGVKDGLTKEQVKALMDVIISNNIFLTKNGSLLSPSKAKVTEKSSRDMI
ncbi:DUF2922 domain-containing protein [Clostridium sp. YIM B02506]|uniref:DUF2922 domain-containing protein n=1 Tax=Clostridium sp. YIM B02506 TaxID=2910680 RepID=UPI001EED9F01|nr:DUF2922 domain-containing protein [Clostridium sp. YIM B02506]